MRVDQAEPVSYLAHRRYRANVTPTRGAAAERIEATLDQPQTTSSVVVSLFEYLHGFASAIEPLQRSLAMAASRTARNYPALADRVRAAIRSEEPLLRQLRRDIDELAQWLPGINASDLFRGPAVVWFDGFVRARDPDWQWTIVVGDLERRESTRMVQRGLLRLCDDHLPSYINARSYLRASVASNEDQIAALDNRLGSVFHHFAHRIDDWTRIAESIHRAQTDALATCVHQGLALTERRYGT